jgi:leucyl-tRNA synthetase
MAEYAFREIEKKWQDHWRKTGVYMVSNDSSKPKYYILDMFPYPSGAGLHVGHPLGYIASDIVARYKRLKGFNVLHPMGYDSFGLPAEQYAIQTGQHPAVTTQNNIARYREQLDSLGFCYDWAREVRTSDPSYYKWTQWIFKLIYNSWYNEATNKAEPIGTLIAILEKEGNAGVRAACDDDTPIIATETWNAFSNHAKQHFLLKYRLTYLAETTVNWCPALGTVLSNDEVKDGFSERGGHPVVKKKMPQWSMRITAYADRLLEGLDRIEWPESVKEMQRNWIGKSVGAEIDFTTEAGLAIRVFTTRIDTIYGATFLVLAPESELVPQLITPAQKKEVDAYVAEAINRSERERMSDVKKVSGVFTGSYAINPFNNERVPIWVADYVLAGYGTGAVMAVPAHDERDHRFAKHFQLPIVQVIDGNTDVQEEAFTSKDALVINSGFLNGLKAHDAIEKAIDFAEEKGFGKRKINFRLRDAIFGRQRYWGEPIPVYYENGTPQLIPDEKLPVQLPSVNEYLPTEDGDPPLGRAKGWNFEGHPYELSTMPGWAGSSWYFFRYMDPTNDHEFASKKALDYWQDVDFYLGGSEHATGHLLYARFWTKFLYDLGYIKVDEFARKLVNQGMILGRSNYVVRYNIGQLEGGEIEDTSNPELKIIKGGEFKYAKTNLYISKSIADGIHKGKIGPIDLVDLLQGQFGDEFIEKHPEFSNPFMGMNQNYVDIKFVKDDILDIEELKYHDARFKDAIFLREGDGKFYCGVIENEKMSKSKYNVVNPDDLVAKYGADTLRMYEMFLGPIEQSKPWNTNGIEGVFKFLKRFWALFHPGGQFHVSDEASSPAELKVLHSTIKKIGQDIESLSLNTSVSAFMIAVNELTSLKCNKRAILEPLTVILSPFAPHMAEELWHQLGNSTSVVDAPLPAYDEAFLVEDTFEYPVSINGKMRVKLNFSLDTTPAEIEKAVLANETVMKWTEGKAPKKVIVVPKKIVNVVV